LPTAEAIESLPSVVISESEIYAQPDAQKLRPASQTQSRPVVQDEDQTTMQLVDNQWKSRDESQQVA